MENLNNKDKKNTIKPHEATKTAGNLINLGHVFVDISQGAFPALIHFLKSAEKSVHFPSESVEFFKELANLRPVENEFFIGWIFFLRMV